jgi:hypothetical protein
MFADLCDDEIGVIPYSIQSGKPVVLLWKESKAIISDLQSSAYYSCILAKKRDEQEEWIEVIGVALKNVFEKVQKIELRIKKFAKIFIDRQFPTIFVPIPFTEKIPHHAMWISLSQLIQSAESQVCAFEGFELYLSLVASLHRNINQLNEFAGSLKKEHKLDFQYMPSLQLTHASVSDELIDDDKNDFSEIFRCRKCRKQVFVDSDLEEHVPGAGQTSFAWRKRDHNQDKVSCNGLFLNSEKALQIWGEVEGNTGKLDCPNCSSRIGLFSWSGAQCSCGCWISPAFKVSNDKIDRKAQSSNSIPS